MAEKQSVTLFVEAGDPACAAAERWLTERGVEFTVRDVKADPAATAAMFGRVGRVVVPAFQIGEKLIIGFDPVQLVRFLPKEDTQEPVSFGAAVRGVNPEVASSRGLPAPFGVEVGPVKDGSPADVAGVAPGDIITAIGAYTITGGVDQFSVAVAARRPGDTMAITVWRDRESRDVAVHFPPADVTDIDSAEAAE